MASKDVVKRVTEEIGSERVWFDLIASLSSGVVACKEEEVEETLQVGRESKYVHKPVQTSSGLKVYTLKVTSKGKHCLKGSDKGFVVHRYCHPL